MRLFMTDKKIRESVQELIDSSIARHRMDRHLMDFVKCEVCGCLIDKIDAIRGYSVIRTREDKIYDPYSYVSPTITTEYIHAPYYCKVHAPKDRKK
jgi:hypothetical protein